MNVVGVTVKEIESSDRSFVSICSKRVVKKGFK